MDVELEDFEFYQVLSCNLPNLYKRILENGCLLCVPPNGSLPKQKELVPHFIKSHVFRPSKEFVGVWHCFEDPGRQVEESKRWLTTRGDSWSSPRKVKVFAEDSIPCKNKKPIKVYFLQNALIGGTHTPPDVTHTFPTTLTHLVDVLLQFSSRQSRLKLDTNIQQFTSAYQLVEEYEHLVTDKIQRMYDQALEEILADNLVKRENRRIYSNVQLAVHSYLLTGIHTKLFGHFKRINVVKDAKCMKYMDSFSAQQMTDFGVPVEVCTPQLKAIHMLPQINDFANPYEKINLLNNVLGVITSEACGIQADGMSADYLIPMLIYVILQSRCPSLCATVHYLQYFMPEVIAATELNYARISFEASVCWIQEEGSKRFPEIDDEVRVEHNNLTQSPRAKDKANKASNWSGPSVDKSKNRNSWSHPPLSLSSSSKSSSSSPEVRTAPVRHSPRHQHPSTPDAKGSAQSSHTISHAAPKAITVNTESKKEMGSFLKGLMTKKDF